MRIPACWPTRTCASGAWRSAPSAGGSRRPAAPSPCRVRPSRGRAAADASSASGVATRRGDRRFAACAADHARLRRRLRRRATARAAGAVPRRAATCGAVPAWASRGRVELVVLAAALVVGLGEEVGLLRRQRALVWVRITSSVGITGAALSTAKPTPSSSIAVQQQRQHQRRAQALALPIAACGAGDGAAHRHRAHCACASRRSIASNSWPAMFSPNCASSSRMQVGLVTLTSVR